MYASHLKEFRLYQTSQVRQERKRERKKIRSSTIAQKHNLSDWIKEEISELNKHFRPTLIIINNIF